MGYALSEQKAELRFRVRLSDDGKTLELTYEPIGDVDVENVRLLDDALWSTDVEKGYVVVPVREGLLIPPDSGRAFAHLVDTFAYEGCHMEMLGLVRNGSGILVTWHDPYVTAEIRSTINVVATQAKQVLSTSLDLRRTARAIKIQFLGPGDYVTIARAYREAAKKKGWLVTWDDKVGRTPEASPVWAPAAFLGSTIMLTPLYPERGPSRLCAIGLASASYLGVANGILVVHLGISAGITM